MRTSIVDTHRGPNARPSSWLVFALRSIRIGKIPSIVTSVWKSTILPVAISTGSRRKQISLPRVTVRKYDFASFSVVTALTPEADFNAACNAALRAAVFTPESVFVPTFAMVFAAFAADTPSLPSFAALNNTPPNPAVSTSKMTSPQLQAPDAANSTFSPIPRPRKIPPSTGQTNINKLPTSCNASEMIINTSALSRMNSLTLFHACCNKLGFCSNRCFVCCAIAAACIRTSPPRVSLSRSAATTSASQSAFAA